MQQEFTNTHKKLIRLDIFLHQYLPQYTRRQIQQSIKQGEVQVNSVVQRKPSHALQDQDKVQVCIIVEENKETTIEPIDLQVQILYEDADCFVVYKPAGISVHPGHSSQKNEQTLLDGIAFLFTQKNLAFDQSTVLVHRLDKNTTGCILIAKHKQALLALQEQFQNRTVEKLYLAIIHGVPKQHKAIIDAPIGRSVHDRTKMAVTTQTHSRVAQTSYELLGCNSESTASLVICSLHTGRTHQIRVHLAAIGHPLVADTAYESGQYLHVFPADTALSLHAFQLTFTHIRSKERITVNSPVPKDFITMATILHLPLPKQFTQVDTQLYTFQSQ